MALLVLTRRANLSEEADWLFRVLRRSWGRSAMEVLLLCDPHDKFLSGAALSRDVLNIFFNVGNFILAVFETIRHPAAPSSRESQADTPYTSPKSNTSKNKRFFQITGPPSKYLDNPS